MWRCAASLERLAPELKESLGEALVRELSRPNLAQSRPLVPRPARRARAALRAGEHGRPARDGRALDSSRCSTATIAPGRETADAIFALSQLARVSGDRARDIDAELRDRVADRLVRLGATRTRSGPSASSPSARRPSRARPSATRCRWA